MLLSNCAIAHRKPESVSVRSPMRTSITAPKISVLPVNLTAVTPTVNHTYKKVAALSGRRAGVAFDHYHVNFSPTPTDFQTYDYGSLWYYKSTGNQVQAWQRRCFYSKHFNLFSQETQGKPNVTILNPTTDTVLNGSSMDYHHLKFMSDYCRKLKGKVHWHALFYVTSSAINSSQPWYHNNVNFSNHFINSKARGDAVNQLYANVISNWLRQKFPNCVASLETTNEFVDTSVVADPPAKFQTAYEQSDYNTPWYAWISDFGLYCRTNHPEFSYLLNDSAHIGTPNTSAIKYRNLRNDINLLKRLSNERGYRPDAFGVQSHIYSDNFDLQYTPAQTLADLTELGALTDEVHISEMDWFDTTRTLSYDVRQRNAAKSAEWYLTTILKFAKTTQLIFWGVDDIQSWKNENKTQLDTPLLPFRFGTTSAANYTIQPMYYAYMRAFEKALPMARNVALTPGQVGNPYPGRYVQISNKRKKQYQF